MRPTVGGLFLPWPCTRTRSPFSKQRVPSEMRSNTVVSAPLVALMALCTENAEGSLLRTAVQTLQCAQSCLSLHFRVTGI